jgi:rhodanese-related sulfurtransferase
MPNKWVMIWQGALILLTASVLGFGVNLVRPDGLSMTGECFKNALLPVGAHQPSVISLDEARRLSESKPAVFIDTRPAEEYLWGHIQGARSLPWEEVEAGRMDGVERYAFDTPLVIYADGVSCGRSAAVAVALYEKGFKNVRVLINGWSLWQEHDLPTEVGRSPF